MKSPNKFPKTRQTLARTDDSIQPQKREKISVCGLILCAGVGARTGLTYNKLLHYIGKKTVLEITLDRFKASRCKSVTLVVSETDYHAICDLVSGYAGVQVCLGGKTRSESVRYGLNEIGSCDIVVIHDGARPYIAESLINKTIDSAIKYGSGILAVPAIDTMKEISNDTVIRTLSRAGLFHIQTPQTFVFEKIMDAYTRIYDDCTDDSEVYQRAGYTPKIVLGSYANIKITTAEDFLRPSSLRSKIGVGFDVHQLVSGRPLILGGLLIPFHKGLNGHSDADVLTHAIMDALLSAAGLPDIGVLFPDTDPRFLGVSSIRLLQEVHALITRRAFSIGNISAVIMAEKPKLFPIIPEICSCLCNALGLASNRLNVSATTTEQLGIIGEGRGIAASATCLLSY